MSFKKSQIRILEIDRSISEKEKNIRDIYQHFTMHRFDAAVEFREEKTSEFKTARVTFLNVGPPLFLRKSFLEIFPEGEEIKDNSFEYFIVDNISKEEFFNILDNRFEVELRLLSEEKTLPV